MDFMNLHQSAHGDREFAFIQTRLRRGRKTVVGHWQDPQVVGAARLRGRGRRPAGTRRTGSGSPGSATTCARSRSPRATRSRPRPGSASRSTATASTTSSTRVAAVARRRGRPARRRPTRTTTTSRRRCGRAATATPSCGRRPGSRPGLRSFLDDGGFGAFTDTFEDLGALAQLPGHRRPAADGRRLRLRRRGRLEGRRARPDPQGRWATGCPAARRSWRTTPTTWATRSRRSSARTCSRSARRSPPAGRRARSTRCRSAAGPTRSGSSSTPRPGPAVVVGLADLGDRFRLIANEVDLVEPDAPLPKLPVARAVWRPRPDLATAAEAWLTAGGPHHTALTTSARRSRRSRDFAEIADIELVDDRRRDDRRARSERELRWNQAYYFLDRGP